MNSDKMTRRRVLGSSLLGLTAIPVMVETALGQAAKPAAAPAKPAAAPAAAGAAGALPLLNPTEPAAKALGYVEDSAKVDAKANPTHKPEQYCGNCLQWTDKNRKAPTSKCNLFPGKMVKNPGWCKVWVKAPGT